MGIIVVSYRINIVIMLVLQQFNIDLSFGTIFNCLCSLALMHVMDLWALCRAWTLLSRTRFMWALCWWLAKYSKIGWFKYPKLKNLPMFFLAWYILANLIAYSSRFRVAWWCMYFVWAWCTLYWVSRYCFLWMHTPFHSSMHQTLFYWGIIDWSFTYNMHQFKSIV